MSAFEVSIFFLNTNTNIRFRSKRLLVLLCTPLSSIPNLMFCDYLLLFLGSTAFPFTFDSEQISRYDCN